MKKHLILFLIFAPFFLNAQVDLQDITSHIALVNAKVVAKPGQVMENATILFKDGIITKIGQNVTIPSDARTILLDSLVIYPGFISGYSKAGLKKDKKSETKEKKGKYTPGNAPDAVAGIQPELSVDAMYDKDDGRIKLLRENGFCVAQVFPNDGMLPGQGSAVLMNNEDYDLALLSENNFQFFQYTPKSGVYPATIIGVMAKFKELFHQSKAAITYENQYKANPIGKKKPSYSSAIKGLYPLVSGQTPLMIACKNDKELHRSIALSKELGFRYIPVGLTDLNPSATVQDQLGNAFLSLNFPKEVKKKKDHKGFTQEEYDSIIDKIEKSRLARINLASRLSKNGKKFGYVTADVAPNDIMKNLKLAVKNGLDERVALEALTSSAAQILGFDKFVGSIERGKLANLVVVDGDLFDEKSKIKHVFINGQQFEIETKKGKSAKTDIMDGLWDFEVDVESTSLNGTMELSIEDELIDIVLEFNNDTHNFENIKPDGNSIELSFNTDYQGESYPVTLVAEFDKSSVTGELRTVNDLNFPLSGSLREPK